MSLLEAASRLLSRLSNTTPSSAFSPGPLCMFKEAVGPSSSSRTTGSSTHRRIAVLPFEHCRTAQPDGPYAPVRERSTDFFPRTAIVPHLEQLCILFWCPFHLFNTPFLSLHFAIGGIWSKYANFPQEIWVPKSSRSQSTTPDRSASKPTSSSQSGPNSATSERKSP